jgi:antitoxin component of RelBE/YafQ-DinJ toxin-antitoxin module
MDQKERKARYDMEYARKNIRRKEIPFNLTQPEDEELFRYLESQGNFTQYIKDLIRKDMNR